MECSPFLILRNMLCSVAMRRHTHTQFFCRIMKIFIFHHSVSVFCVTNEHQAIITMTAVTRTTSKIECFYYTINSIWIFVYFSLCCFSLFAVFLSLSPSFSSSLSLDESTFWLAIQSHAFQLLWWWKIIIKSICMRKNASLILDHSYEIFTSNPEERKKPSLNLTQFGLFPFFNIAYATA